MRGSVGVVLAALGAAACAPPALAQTKVGTSIGEFLRIEPSARVAAMGNAGVTLFDGLDAAYYNPAAIASVERWAVEFSHSLWLADISYDYVAGALPMGKWGNGYASVTALNSGEIDVRTVAQPLGTGERFSVTDVAIGLGYGKEITDRFAFGVQTTWFQETIWHVSASAMTLSIGTMYRTAPNGLHIGASLTNFGTDGRFSGRDLRIVYDNDPSRYGDNGALPAERFTDPYAVPTLFRVGAGMPFRFGPAQRLRVSIDAFHPGDNTESVSWGAEWKYREALALRAGWQDAFLPNKETGLTLGAGTGGSMADYGYRVDYGWADHGRLGSTHRLTVGIEF